VENHEKLCLSQTAQDRLIVGARDDLPVAGLTHNFYRYPARFSPRFVRAAIETFTRPGDLVLDPFLGGGTSLVEALALGRDGVGVDISSLAEFVSTVKTTVLEQPELDRLTAWAERLSEVINIRLAAKCFDGYAEAGYYKHLNSASRWRLRKCVEQAVWSAKTLRCRRLEEFARCVVLRTAQWALDGRKRLPTVAEFRDRIRVNAHEMIAGARGLGSLVNQCQPRSKIRVINRSANGLEGDPYISMLRPPNLVITSPPYPGIHVLYHRWQVDGRKEAPLPFMIANKLDGAGSSYYTMGDRQYPELATYFASLKGAMTSVAAVADERTVVVQMVAFSDPSRQLPRYLETMREAGLQEMFLPSLQGERDGRLWRSVPGRRWYSDQRGDTPGSQEVVLIHRKTEAAAIRPSRRDRSGRLPLRQDRRELGSLGR